MKSFFIIANCSCGKTTLIKNLNLRKKTFLVFDHEYTIYWHKNSLIIDPDLLFDWDYVQESHNHTLIPHVLIHSGRLRAVIVWSMINQLIKQNRILYIGHDYWSNEFFSFDDHIVKRFSRNEHDTLKVRLERGDKREQIKYFPYANSVVIPYGEYLESYVKDDILKFLGGNYDF